VSTPQGKTRGSVRDQISAEMWEEVNRLYLFLHSEDGRTLWRQAPSDFYKEIKQSSYLYQGLTNSTMPHNEGRDFIQVGRFLERADKTTRLLDVKYHILLPEGNEVGRNHRFGAMGGRPPLLLRL
jgi:uncharacterized alpha-E superfamily protein